MFGLFKKKDSTVTDSSDSKATAPERDTITPIPREKPTAHVSAPVMDEFVQPPSMITQGQGSGIPSGIPGFDYNPVDTDEEFKANGGKPLAEGAAPASKDDVLAALQTVYDPEIPRSAILSIIRPVTSEISPRPSMATTSPRLP